MPLNVDPTKVNAVQTNLEVVAPRDPRVTMSEQIGGAQDLDNIAVSVFNRASEEDHEPEPEFDLEANLLPGEELVASEFADANSLAELNQIRERRLREDEARRLLEEGPLNEFVASAIAVVSDPTTYIPLFGAVGKAGKMAKIGRTGALAAGEAAVSEAALRATQETRSAEESVAAIMLGGAFGFGLGALGVAASRGLPGGKAGDKAYEAAVDDTVTLMRAEFPESTAGAAQYRPIDPQDSKLASSLGLAPAMAKLSKVGMAAPGLEMLASRFAAARELVLRLTDTGVVTKGAVRGIADPQALETRIKRYDAVMAGMGTDLKMAYKGYRSAGGKLSRDDFYRQVGRAMRRGDKSPIPEVEAAAQKMRKDVFDPLKAEAVKLKLLPEGVDVRTATSYFTRVYKRNVIRAQRPQFKARIEGWLRRTIKADRLAADAEYGDIADGIIDTILGNSTGRVPFINVPKVRGPLKERTFNIPDNEIEDFLEDNVLEVGSRYTRTLAADIEFQKEFGTTTPQDEIAQRIQDEANEQIGAAKTDRERRAIQDDADRATSVLSELMNRIRGTTNHPEDPAFFGLGTIARTARNFNFVRLLGAVTVSSIADLGQIVLQEGLGRSLGTVIADFGRGFKGIRMAKAEAQLAGTALDLVMSQRVRAILDLGDRYAAETALEKVERASQNAANVFAQATLINAWNTGVKSITSAMVSSRILKTVKRLAASEKVSASDMRRLAQSGIDREMALRIADEAGNWQQEGPVLVANTPVWKDQGAVNVFRNALLRDVDNTIITPGAGDAPLWTSTEWGKTVFQFKRFAAASTQRVLVSGLQKRDMATLNGMLALVAMGGLSTALRDLSAGELRERSARQWVADSIDRSGLMSLFFEADALMEKTTGVSPITSATGQEVSRFAGREVSGQILGPTVGLAESLSRAAVGVTQGDFTQSDLHRIRKLVPGQNLFYLRYMLDQLEEGTADELGLQKRRR